MLFEYKGRRYPEYLKHGNGCQYIAAAALKFCKGRGFDVGAGKWPLPGALAIDITSGGDAAALPEGQYDYVFSSHCLEHLSDPVAAIEHWKSRLRPYGVLFLYLPHPEMEYWLPQNNRKHLHAWQPQEIEKLLRDLGFVDVLCSERDLAWGFAVVGFAPTTGALKAFKAKAVEYGGAGIFRLSALSIRDGAGVIDRVLGSGKYKTVLEIGTFRGIGAAYMARYCERVVTIDLNYGRLEQLGESFDRPKFWQAMGVHNVDLILVENAEEKAKIVEGLQFDLAFIDGGKNDIAEDFALVKRCGAVLFHDYDRRGRPELDAVYDFVNTLPPEQVEIMDIFALWTAPA